MAETDLSVERKKVNSQGQFIDCFCWVARILTTVDGQNPDNQFRGMKALDIDRIFALYQLRCSSSLSR